MNNIYKTYLNMFNSKKSVILEQDEELEEQTDSTTQTAEEPEKVEEAEKPEEKAEPETTETKDTANNIDMKFSADLASEFGNTVNQFTHVAADIIKQRSISKESTDKIYDLMGKIKDLLDAASKSI